MLQTVSQSLTFLGFLLLFFCVILSFLFCFFLIGFAVQLSSETGLATLIVIKLFPVDRQCYCLPRQQYKLLCH